MNPLLRSAILAVAALSSAATHTQNELPPRESLAVAARGDTDSAQARASASLPRAPGSRSVTEFGAVGDGIADDTPAIVAAIQAVEAGPTGGIVFFPPGTYAHTGFTISGAIRSVQLVGAGWAQSILKNIGRGTSITIGTGAADFTRDIRIVGLGVLGQANSEHGIHVKRVHHVIIDGCRIQRHGGDGIRFDKAYACSVTGHTYSNNNGGAGFRANEDNDLTVIERSRFLANGGPGVWFANGSSSGTRIIHNDIEGNLVGLKIDAGTSGSQAETYLVGWNYFEGQRGKNISLGEDEGATRFVDSPTMIGNQINQGAGTGDGNAVSLGRVRQPMIQGNSFGRANLLTSVLTSGGFLLNNRFSSGSTYSASGWIHEEGNTLNGVGVPGIRLGGMHPGITFAGDGRPLERVGTGFVRDALEMGVNVTTTGAISGDLDDSSLPGMVLRLRPTTLQLLGASAGSGARPLTEHFSFDSAASTLAVNGRLQLWGSHPGLVFLDAGGRQRLHVGAADQDSVLELASNAAGASETTARLDSPAEPGMLVRIAPQSLRIASASSGPNPRRVTEHLYVGATGETRFNGHRMEWSATDPRSGVWAQGDVVWNSGATAGGVPGWICVAGGSPGTWKAMAKLAP